MMKNLCVSVENVFLQVFHQGITVAINNISMMCDINDVAPGVIPEGHKLSCSGLSRHLNLESDEWDESNFHSQQRQTNLNLWYNYNGGKYYASVYPKGSIRITSSDADASCAMVDSLVSHMRMIKISDLVQFQQEVSEHKWPQVWTLSASC